LAKTSRVVADAKGNRDRLGRSSRRKCSRIASSGDNGHAPTDEVGHERWQAIVLAAEPVVLDEDVLALDIAAFAKAFGERGCMPRGAVERPAADTAHHRHCLLLTTRHHRPRRRASQTRNELAPL
jgi:hypothetical protein